MPSGRGSRNRCRYGPEHAWLMPMLRPTPRRSRPTLHLQADAAHRVDRRETSVFGLSRTTRKKLSARWRKGTRIRLAVPSGGGVGFTHPRVNVQESARWLAASLLSTMHHLERRHGCLPRDSQGRPTVTLAPTNSWLMLGPPWPPGSAARLRPGPRIESMNSPFGGRLRKLHRPISLTDSDHQGRMSGRALGPARLRGARGVCATAGGG